MLTVFRRHLKKCKHAAKGRKYRTCSCPLAVEGTLRGDFIRRSLDVRSWEAALRLVREWEIEGKTTIITVRQASERFIADCTARQLSEAMLGTYKHVVFELNAAFGERYLGNVETDDVRSIREGWSDLTAIFVRVVVRILIDHPSKGSQNHIVIFSQIAK